MAKNKKKAKEVNVIGFEYSVMFLEIYLYDLHLIHKTVIICLKEDAREK